MFIYTCFVLDKLFVQISFHPWIIRVLHFLLLLLHWIEIWWIFLDRWSILNLLFLVHTFRIWRNWNLFLLFFYWTVSPLLFYMDIDVSWLDNFVLQIFINIQIIVVVLNVDVRHVRAWLLVRYAVFVENV